MSVHGKVVWAFLAAEDVNFYEHPGFDATAILNCGIRNLAGTSGCGGSTITQQLVKQTVLTNERKVERKIKELILSMQVERLYTKDQILAMYLTVIPEGSNIYGINRASRFYFGKEMNKLSLAEVAVLASIPQNPSVLSPTVSISPEIGAEKLKARQEYVLDQMLKHKNKINDEVGNDQFITEEKIEKAKKQKLKYKEPNIDIKAPHFVFYVQKLLQQRGYNDGKPFTYADIETGGYSIKTTLDLDLQNTAQDFATQQGVGVYGARYGAENAALTTLDPKTGEVLAYVGSRDYDGKSSPPNCESGVNCRFEGNVDILSSLQQPGSSAKPITYYNAFDQGILAPGSYLADIPIAIGNYKPKNSDGRFSGLGTARSHLVNSKNIPAIEAVMASGVGNYVETAKKFGYTTFGDVSQYGPAITLGAADVKGIEHAEAFGVFANGGDRVRHEVILEIKDKNGKVIFEYKPKKERVADPAAIYMVDDVLKGVPAAAPNIFANDGRDVAGKTGTSESQKDTWYVFFSPDFVTVGWLGNNDNTPMRYGAFGSTSVKPWVQAYMSSVMSYFPDKTPFTRPSNVVRKQYCSGSGSNRICSASNDLVIEGKYPPVYLSKKAFQVCDDQQTRLARDIDKTTGHAINKTYTTYTMPEESLQKYADKYFASKGQAYPTAYCTIDRSPNKGKPWAVFSNPISGATYTDNMPIAFKAYAATGSVKSFEVYVDSTQVASQSGDTYSGSFDVSSLSAGTHSVRAVITDSNGKTGESSVSIIVSSGGFTITSPGATVAAGSINVTADFSGSGNPGTVTLCVDGTCNITMSASGNTYSATWNATAGTHTIYVTSSGGASSSAKSIDVV